MKFALFFGNRGFFPEKLIDEARTEIKGVVESLGYETLIMPEGITKYGAVETVEDGRKYAAFLKQHEYDGVILSLPNFGDENGAITALEDADVPILVQAHPDEIGKMDFANRRDAFCGKFSVMDVFYQHGLPYTTFSHVCDPESDAFRQEVIDFAAVCRIVKGMKRFNVGAIGARTTLFKTIRFDEITLQKYGINTETVDLSEVFHRIDALGSTDAAVIAKKKRFAEYTDFSKVPADKADVLAKLSVALDDIIKDYRLNCLALRCWNEFEMYLGVAPCVVLSELNDRGFAAACELDVCNAISMQAISLATEKPATCLDWNNNYGSEKDKCILFHCGPVPKSLMEPDSGHVTDHKMFSKSYGTGSGWGSNEGRIASGDMTFASAKTHNGSLVFYIDEGEFTSDPIEKEFFGCGGVALIPELEKKLNMIGRRGYRHHVSVGRGHVARAIREAFDTYLKYSIEDFGK
jgi:L-fucose isomerase-like protein